uniref:Uncharacterized protein n=1 Tax=Panagrolaimus sp. JU765 TaxID=591449 RepID=A0AC34QYZ6_9BILA
MSSAALKRFVVDGNANGHEKRLAILRNCTWNLPNSKQPKKLAKKTKNLLNQIEINFEKQIRTFEAFEQDAKDYDEENQRMVGWYVMYSMVLTVDLWDDE